MFKIKKTPRCEKRKWFYIMMKFFQRLGKALMLPVACLPVCGILMGIGYILAPAAMAGEVQGFTAGGLSYSIGLFLIKAGGALIDNFPNGSMLAEAKPHYEYVEGWHCDISGCRSFDELPKAARAYVEMIEKAVGCPIKYVSVGAGRDEYIER